MLWNVILALHQKRGKKLLKRGHVVIKIALAIAREAENLINSDLMMSDPTPLDKEVCTEELPDCSVIGAEILDVLVMIAMPGGEPRSCLPNEHHLNLIQRIGLGDIVVFQSLTCHQEKCLGTLMVLAIRAGEWHGAVFGTQLGTKRRIVVT